MVENTRPPGPEPPTPRGKPHMNAEIESMRADERESQDRRILTLQARVQVLERENAHLKTQAEASARKMYAAQKGRAHAIAQRRLLDG